MTANTLRHGRAPFSPAPGPSAELTELISHPNKLVLSVLDELARIHSNRSGVTGVELRLRSGLLFVDTADPLQRRVIWAGTGDQLDAWFEQGWREIGAFAPGFVDLLHLGPTQMNVDARHPIVQEWMGEQTWDVRSRLPDPIRHSSMRLEDAWWGQIELIRASTVVGEYYRRYAAALLRQGLQEPADDPEKYFGRIRSCIRFCFPNSVMWGRTFVPMLDPEPGVTNLVYTIQKKSRVLAALHDIGWEGHALRFEVTPRDQPTQDEVKAFARSLKRHGIAKIGVVVSRRAPLWDFAALAGDLRAGANFTTMLLSLTHRDLLDLIDSAEAQGFDENERWLIDRLTAAFHQGLRTYSYEIECSDGTDPHCEGSISNPLVFGGLRKGQLRDLAADGSVELDHDQIRRNWHVLSLADRAAAQRGEPVYLEAELDTVCGPCGSDRDTGD